MWPSSCLCGWRSCTRGFSQHVVRYVHKNLLLRHVCTEESMDWGSFFHAIELIFAHVRGSPKHAMIIMAWCISDFDHFWMQLMKISSRASGRICQELRRHVQACLSKSRHITITGISYIWQTFMDRIFDSTDACLIRTVIFIQFHTQGPWWIEHEERARSWHLL